MSNARNLARLLPNASGQLPDAAMSSGSVLQVVQATYAAATTTTSTSQVDSGLTAQITPSSPSSKILVLLSQKVWCAGSNGRYEGRIVRNGTNITTMWGGYYGSTELADSATMSYLDSPNSTSLLTYKTTYAMTYGSRIDMGAAPDSVATLTLIEIAP